MDNHILFGANGEPLYTSDQAAARIGKTRSYLIKLLFDHNHLRPSAKVGQDYFWTEGEIDAVTERRAIAKRGRPVKK